MYLLILYKTQQVFELRNTKFQSIICFVDIIYVGISMEFHNSKCIQITSISIVIEVPKLNIYFINKLE